MGNSSEKKARAIMTLTASGHLLLRTAAQLFATPLFQQDF
jgi:hypothetical protein